MSVLAPAFTRSLAQPLYALEEQLTSLIDSIELVPPEQEQEFREEFQHALATAVEKRDRVGQFMAHIELQIAFATSEIERLKERRAAYERALERIGEYVKYTIASLGRDAKGKYRKLEGKTVTFSLAACPPSVEVIDAAAVPAEYKALIIKMPALVWEKLLESLDQVHRDKVIKNIHSREFSVDKRSIKAAISAGEVVCGADLSIGKTSLRRG
jgi:hypothetical protein